MNPGNLNSFAFSLFSAEKKNAFPPFQPPPQSHLPQLIQSRPADINITSVLSYAITSDPIHRSQITGRRGPQNVINCSSGPKEIQII